MVGHFDQLPLDDRHRPSGAQQTRRRDLATGIHNPPPRHQGAAASESPLLAARNGPRRHAALHPAVPSNAIAGAPRAHELSGHGTMSPRSARTLRPVSETNDVSTQCRRTRRGACPAAPGKAEQPVRQPEVIPAPPGDGDGDGPGIAESQIRAWAGLLAGLVAGNLASHCNAWSLTGTPLVWRRRLPCTIRSS